MKIPVLYIPKTNLKKYLVVEKRFKCKTKLLPIGCDCHPAYTLQKLNLRKFSLPFDWLNTDPIEGINYVVDNIENSFNFFLSGLMRNEDDHIISKKYPYAEFLHEKFLIEKKQDQDKFIRRIDRFRGLIKSKCSFLYNIPSEALDSEKKVTKFINSITRFEDYLVNDQKLYIYIRYDEDLKENQIYCNQLMSQLNEFRFVRAINYVREKKEFGIWGNEKMYPELYENLGIQIKSSFPKIYFE